MSGAWIMAREDVGMGAIGQATSIRREQERMHSSRRPTCTAHLSSRRWMATAHECCQIGETDIAAMDATV